MFRNIEKANVKPSLTTNTAISTIVPKYVFAIGEANEKYTLYVSIWP